MAPHTNSRFALRTVFVGIAIAALSCWLIVTFHPFGPLLAWLFLPGCLATIAVCMRQRLPLVVACMILLVGLFAFPVISMSGHPVSIRRLSHVHSGTTADRVRSLLGNPSKIHSSDDGDLWVYSGFTWCYITIHFAPDGTVAYIDHDH